MQRIRPKVHRACETLCDGQRDLRRPATPSTAAAPGALAAARPSRVGMAVCAASRSGQAMANVTSRVRNRRSQGPHRVSFQARLDKSSAVNRHNCHSVMPASAQALIELDRGRVPVEHGPLHAAAPALAGHARQMEQQGLAQIPGHETPASRYRSSRYRPGRGEEGRVVEEVERESRRCAIHFADHAEGVRATGRRGETASSGHASSVVSSCSSIFS